MRYDGPSAFQEKLYSPGSFAVCLHLRPHYEGEPLSHEALSAFFGEASGERRIDAFFLSDAPTTLKLAEDILRAGSEPVVSLSTAEGTADEIAGTMRRYHEAGIRNLLIVTGDYPVDPPEGARLFDLDSVQLLMLLRGGSLGTGRGKLSAGCVVSPFKTLESEQLWQYAKLVRKVEYGAEFIVTHPGYDLRKFDELLRFCRQERLDTPLVANLLVPDLELASRIREGAIPGLKIPRALLRKIEEEEKAGARGLEEKLRRAARTTAVLRGMGYRGLLLGGPGLTCGQVRTILDESERYYPEWRNYAGECDFPEPRFYYFQPAPDGLNSDRPGEVSPPARRHPMYVMSDLVDKALFDTGGLFSPYLSRLSRLCDTRRSLTRALWLLELAAKGPMYRCRMCGDCTLYACGFLCNESGCPKKMANGPCGGTLDGYCEVTPGRKKCFWVKVHERLKGTAVRPGFPVPPVPAKNRRLDGTCSWINFFQGRDHRKMRIPPARPRRPV